MKKLSSLIGAGIAAALLAPATAPAMARDTDRKFSAEAAFTDLPTGTRSCAVRNSAP